MGEPESRLPLDFSRGVGGGGLLGGLEGLRAGDDGLAAAGEEGRAGEFGLSTLLFSTCPIFSKRARSLLTPSISGRLATIRNLQGSCEEELLLLYKYD